MLKKKLIFNFKNNNDKNHTFIRGYFLIISCVFTVTKNVNKLHAYNQYPIQSATIHNLTI